MSIKRNHHNVDDAVGSSFQSFLEEAGIAEEVHAIAIARVTAWQAQETLKASKAKKETTR